MVSDVASRARQNMSVVGPFILGEDARNSGLAVVPGAGQRRRQVERIPLRGGVAADLRQVAAAAAQVGDVPVGAGGEARGLVGKVAAAGDRIAVGAGAPADACLFGCRRFRGSWPDPFSGKCGSCWRSAVRIQWAAKGRSYHEVGGDSGHWLGPAGQSGTRRGWLLD